jgi:hypothetical protein
LTNVSPKLVESLLAHARKRGRVIFSLDATLSRQTAWDAAAKLTDDMFSAVVGLETQLVFYRGIAECTASRWMRDARALTTAMSSIVCRAGETQIYRVLYHAKREHEKQPVNALIFIGDACEESRIDLVERAGALPMPLFVFQEGNAPIVTELFRELAHITGGAHAAFDPSAPRKLADLLRAVAAFAGGGIEALEHQQTGAAKLLLSQIKK